MLLAEARSWLQRAGRLAGLLPYRFFRLPLCWGYQFSGFPGRLCFNLSPRSRLCRLLLSLSQEEMEAQASRAGSGASGFPGTQTGITRRLRSPPTCLPPNRPVNY